jgi:hypothetical protein
MISPLCLRCSRGTPTSHRRPCPDHAAHASRCQATAVPTALSRADSTPKAPLPHSPCGAQCQEPTPSSAPPCRFKIGDALSLFPFFSPSFSFLSKARAPRALPPPPCPSQVAGEPPLRLNCAKHRHQPPPLVSSIHASFSSSDGPCLTFPLLLRCCRRSPPPPRVTRAPLPTGNFNAEAHFYCLIIDPLAR